MIIDAILAGFTLWKNQSDQTPEVEVVVSVGTINNDKRSSSAYIISNTFAKI